MENSPADGDDLRRTRRARRARETFDDRIMTIGRSAVLTRVHKGRAACHYCGVCHRGASRSPISAVEFDAAAAAKTESDDPALQRRSQRHLRLPRSVKPPACVS